MTEQLHTLLEEGYEDMVAIRRHLHQYPELSFQETKTAAFIADFYDKCGIQYEKNVGGNGLVARVKGGKPGKTVALRADFDALPIQDQKDVPYKSTVPGVMHACGHDGHTALLLVLARSIHSMRENLEGEYVFIHQHAEEYAPGGAKPMIEAGCLDGVDAIFGTHLWSTVKTGELNYRIGPVMAAADRFEIKIQGRGGHGAKPHETKDALVTGAQLVTSLQQIVSRRVNPVSPAVVTVASFIADNAFNVISDTAVLTGTVRTFDEDVRSFVEKEIGRIVEGTCLAADCTAEYIFERGYPAVVTHKEETEFLLKAAEEVAEVEAVKETELAMGGEDFAYYLQHVKGTFFFTGAMPESGETFGHHHPKFDINEKSMLIAAKVLGTAAVSYHSAELGTKPAAAAV